MSVSLRKSAIKGLAWSAFERMSGQFVGFIVIVIMSRILTQADYGLVGMLVIFIEVAQTLTDSGVTQALIRKPHPTQADCATAFFFNVILALVLYGLLCFFAPYIAKFFNQPMLISLTRVISLSVVINALMMVQKALFTINVDFKTQAKASLVAAIIAGIAGIGMAYRGFGVWSIVYYQLLNLGLTCGLLWIYSKWRPSFEFSCRSLHYFFNFGSKLTIAGLIHSLYKNMYLAAIGKFYQPASLGIYTRAHQFGSLPSYNINNIVQRVSYPILCKIQENEGQLVKTFMKFVRVTTFLVFPMMIGLAVLAKPIVRLLLGEPWEYAGTLLSIMCIFMMWLPIDSLNLNLLQVRGRTDCYLKCEIWKKVIGVGILIVTIPLGLEIICWGQVVRALLDLMIDSYYTNRFFGLRLVSQMKALMPSLSYSLVMGVIVWGITKTVSEDWLKIIIGLISGVVIYFILAKITSSSDLKDIISIIRECNNKRSENY